MAVPPCMEWIPLKRNSFDHGYEVTGVFLDRIDRIGTIDGIGQNMAPTSSLKTKAKKHIK